MRVICTVIDSDGNEVRRTDLAATDVPGRVAAALDSTESFSEPADDGCTRTWARGDGW